MRKVLLFIFVIIMIATPVKAMEFTAPEAPSSAQNYMPDSSETFWDGLWSIVKSAIVVIRPSVADALKICAALIAVALVFSVVPKTVGTGNQIVNLICTVSIAVLLVQPSNTMIQLGTNTVRAISDYTKLLLPVITAALAAQGGTTTSAALYAGTTVFNTAVNSVLVRLFVPAIYAYMILCIANHSLTEGVLKKMCDFLKWAITWMLKITLYIFTGYIGITGVISGTVDNAAIKATKLAITGFVPVVGNILSDASETVLVSAGVMKNSVGIYGLFVILALLVEPFLHIGIQYVLLKATAAICGLLGKKDNVGLIDDFAGIMGFILAVIGIVSVVLMVTIVCFMKGITQ